MSAEENFRKSKYILFIMHQIYLSVLMPLLDNSYPFMVIDNKN